MSFKFVIMNSQPPAEKEGQEIVRFTGTAEPFIQSTERESTEVGVDAGGNPRIIYNTGLNRDKVDLYRWLNEDEKEALRKQMDELVPLITKTFGPTILAEDNQNFWGRRRKEINVIKVVNETEKIFFDTGNALHALLYLSIMSGAFMDVVAPTKAWAESHQLPHYLALETDAVNFDGDEDINRLDAAALLGELRKEAPEALLILAWCLLSETSSFGGVNKATSQKELLQSFAKYIDGKLVTKKKRNCSKVFIEYAEKWKSQVLRPSLYAEAYLKSGEYFAFINQREKKYTTASGTALGNTVQEAVDNLLKPKFSADLENLREAVEKKWTE
jgi:hypothetical protein